MKDGFRVLGIDDGPFRFSREISPPTGCGESNAKNTSDVLIAGVVCRVPGYVEMVLSDKVEIDGADASQKIIGLIGRVRQRPLSAVFLDGLAVGGFNIVDMARIFRETGVPVITVTRDEPDIDAMKKALIGHFADWEKRLLLVTAAELHEVDTGHNPIYVSCTGIGIEEAKEIIAKSIIRGAMPEALRLAHMIAGGIVKGESSGKT
ncbi:MAG: hypothetical protein CVT48_05245 [Thermoplasmata archaeon HGW-Thermoplasmata-1]|nr:MAG: hypothetical protein CVT48_05245 [Thermoplasmata archaeon HGW-Thermoplasmata-1]